MSKRLMVISTILVTIILASATVVSAQETQPPARPEQQLQPGMQPPPPGDPLADSMFPPELIMQHQRELALTDAQKTFMRSEIQRTTTRFNELQWQLQDSMEALHETMKGNQVNEQQAMEQLGKVLDTEREIKMLHMGMAIRIKNQLTPDQQTKLQTMRGPRPDGRRRERGLDGPDGPPKEPRPGGGPGGPGGAPRPGGPPGGPLDF